VLGSDAGCGARCGRRSGVGVGALSGHDVPSGRPALRHSGNNGYLCNPTQDKRSPRFSYRGMSDTCIRWAASRMGHDPIAHATSLSNYKRRNISKGGIQNQKGTKFVSYSSSTLALLFHLESPLGLGLSSFPSSRFLHLDCSASSKPPPLRSCTLICIGIKLFCELIRKGVLTVM
jgi:hypothetical protein